MRNKILSTLYIGLAIFSQSVHADSTSLLTQAQLSNASRYQFALANNAEIRATPDNKAFTIWWQPSAGVPNGVIVGLHGHATFATDDFYAWQSYAKDRGYAILALQWWFGGGEAASDYYQPSEIYPILAHILAEKGVRPGTALLQGYSRGSANSYAVTALDTASGNRFFGSTLSISGGAAADFTPNQQIAAGVFGPLPFTGVNWILYCAELDPTPTRDGCPGMTASKNWVSQYGATVKLLIDDPTGDHSGFMTNSANVNQALDQFIPSASRTLYLATGWNLLGNTVNGDLAVASVLSDATKITSVWKWSNDHGKWALYAPSLSSQSLSDYATSKNYDVLSTISAGEGFWVNAKVATSITLPDAQAVVGSSVQSGLRTGWSLVGVGEPKAPSDFDSTSLWAWDPVNSKWYFFAPSLNLSGELASYVQTRDYLNFETTGKKLLQGTGFWVNKTNNTPASATLAAPTNVLVGNYSSQTVGNQTFASSTKLQVSWTAPASTAHHYEIGAVEAVQNTRYTTTSTTTSVVLQDLKASTSYSVTVKSCSDANCLQSAAASAVSGTTSGEYWQLQGSGNTTAGLTRIVGDGNVRISATRIGSDAGTSTAGKVQLYYGPDGQTSPRQALSTALTGSVISVGTPSSYLSFTSSGATTGLITPATAATTVKQIATGQGVPLSAALGSKIRLFFEAQGSDNKTRIYALDSQDGYVGQDFNSGSATTCSTVADYSTGGGCVPTVLIGVDGDSVNPNSKISNARQFKLGFPILSDWRWDGAVGTFMVFTTDTISGCTAYNMNHGYAVWSGTSWVVQYESGGCPKLFKSAQAAFPMHLGGVRYKLYHGDPSMTTGKLTGSMPFLGPKKLIYADGTLSGNAHYVDFEDWENQAFARDVAFLWPNGDRLDSTAQGYIDDYHFLAPTASLDLQVMYLAITNGTEVPFGGAAILLNP
jgi:hypothetical protein